MGCTRTCAPGGTSTLYCPHNSGGCSLYCHSKLVLRTLKIRSLERERSSSRLIPSRMASNPCSFTVSRNASVFNAPQHSSRPHSGFIPSARASRLAPTSNCRPHSLTMRSRWAIISGILKVVSICTSGMGQYPRNALRASHNSTVESLPIDHKIPGLRNLA
ncbi:hypothetical protein SDC9_132035 [bioreactor metagenome]|uniref:Uncharacterized protein n=1 Tax=bioreactor metagenome TaxID=1076179 RepID=A0A645D6W5_9ZZZZ